MNRPDEAITSLKQAVRFKLDMAAYYLFGWIYVDTGNKDSAPGIVETLRPMNAWVANCLVQLIKKKLPE